MPLADIPPLRPPRRAKKPAAPSQGPADPGATTTLSGGAETRAGPSNATRRKATPASIASEHAAPDSSGIQTPREPTSDQGHPMGDDSAVAQHDGTSDISRHGRIRKRTLRAEGHSGLSP